MTDTNALLGKAVVSGAVASVLSTAVLALCGQIENRRPAGPINGPSQWVYGRAAAKVRKPTVRHTLVGFVIHHVMSTGWALAHERVFGRREVQQTFSQRLARAAATAAVANFVDFQLTPKRLRPGFERQLSRKSLLAVYTAFAVGLALVAPREPAAKILTRESDE